MIPGQPPSISATTNYHGQIRFGKYAFHGNPPVQPRIFPETVLGRIAFHVWRTKEWLACNCLLYTSPSPRD